jgi:UDP-N-acetyl-D-mannosaminuronate dehydrogenase
MRPTHSNIMFPGPGIGGYCLPKDGGLGFWAYKNILGFDDGDSIFKITPVAVDTNDTRALHVAELTRDALRNMTKYIAGSEVLICGASYRQDVGDTRYSGSEMLARRMHEMGADIKVHDSYVDHWYELEDQDHYYPAEHSWKRFFNHQENLKDTVVQKDLAQALKGVEAVVFAVPHTEYMNLAPDDVVKWAGQPIAVVDCYGILSDEKIHRYFELGCEVKALGRGHIQRIKNQVLRKQNDE